jgi:purine-nucleoside phosphorylase
MAAGVAKPGETEAKALHHEEVMETANRVESQFTSLLKALIPQVASSVT